MLPLRDADKTGSDFAEDRASYQDPMGLLAASAL